MGSRRRRLGSAAVCALALVALAGCSNNSSNDATTQNGQNGGTAGAVRGGTLNLLGAGDTDYMDPNISYYSVGYTTLRMWSRQLVTFPATPGRTTTPVPDLATDIPTPANGGVSADGTNYTFTIRQGAEWNTSPARQVTAADEVRGVKRTCNPYQPFGGIPDFSTLIVGYQKFCDGFAKVPQTATAIKDYIDRTPLPGVVAKDERTVVFRLTHPATYFVDMLTMPAFSPAPAEVLDYLPASSALAQHEISDGPYQIDSYQPTKQIVFSRNPAWSSETDGVRAAYVDKVVIDETVSQDSIQQQLQTGTPTADMEYDQAPPPSQLPGLIASKDPNLNLGETASSNPYIVFNTVSPNNGRAMSKLKVRQALEYAINRDNVIQVLGDPKLNPPLTHVLPSNVVGSRGTSSAYRYDPSRAKQLLAEAGYPNGLTLKFLYRNASEGSRKTFQTVQQDLSKAGIKVVGVPSPDADFYTKYLQVPSAAQRGVWDLSLAGWGADWYGNAALSFFAPLFSGQPSFPPTGSNFGFYDSAATNRLIQQASTAQTVQRAAALWASADQQVMKDAAFFPLTSPQQANYHASQVHNAVYVPALQNFDPTNVWLSADKQGG